MTHSILNDILLIKDEPLSKFEEYFSTIGAGTFLPIIEEAKASKDKFAEVTAKNKILFALLAFDEDSPMIISRQDSKEEKEKICAYLDIPEFERTDLVYLKDPTLRRCITEYLIQFAGEMFRNYMFMRIQLQDYELTVTNRAFLVDKTLDEDGNTVNCHYDIKEHSKVVKEKNALSALIEKAERDLKQKVRLRGIEIIREHTARFERKGRVAGGKRGAPENLVQDNSQK